MTSRLPRGQTYARPERNSPGARQLRDVDAVFGALAHPTRRHILLVLHFRGGAMKAGEIADRFDCSWPTVTRHLKVLIEAGVVEVEIQGRERIYRLKGRRLHDVATRWLSWFADD